MNYLDVIVLIPVLWGAYKGFSNGLISEGGTVLALVLGIWASVSFSETGGEYVAKFLSITGQYKEIVAFSLIFLIVVIICFIITRLLTKLFETIKLGWLNKLLGIVFGATKYIIVFAFVFFFIQTLVQRYYTEKVESFENSLFFNPLANSAKSLLEGTIQMPDLELNKEKVEMQ